MGEDHGVTPSQEKNAGALSLEARRAKFVGKNLPFEVDRNERYCGRSCNSSGVQLSRFQTCVAGWSALKHAQAGVRIAAGEGVEPCAQDVALIHAAGNSVRDLIFRLAAARRPEGAEGAKKIRDPRAG